MDIYPFIVAKATLLVLGRRSDFRIRDPEAEFKQGIRAEPTETTTACGVFRGVETPEKGTCPKE